MRSRAQRGLEDLQVEIAHRFAPVPQGVGHAGEMADGLLPRLHPSCRAVAGTQFGMAAELAGDGGIRQRMGPVAQLVAGGQDEWVAHFANLLGHHS